MENAENLCRAADFENSAKIYRSSRENRLQNEVSKSDKKQKSYSFSFFEIFKFQKTKTRMTFCFSTDYKFLLNFS